MSRPSVERVAGIRRTYGNLCEWSTLFAEIDALQSELDAARAELAEQKEFNRTGAEWADRQCEKLRRELSEAQKADLQRTAAIRHTDAGLAEKIAALEKQLADVTTERDRLKTREQRYIMPNRDDFYLSAEDLDRLINEAEPATDLGHAVKDLLLSHYMGHEAIDLRSTQTRLVEALEWIKKYSATVGPFGCAVYDKADEAITAAKSMEVKS